MGDQSQLSNRVHKYVEEREALNKIGPRDMSYNGFSIVRGCLERAWEKLSEEEQSQARTVLLYKGIQI